MSTIIQLENVSKDYRQAGQRQTVLHDINLQISNGEFVAIVGPSGNGKTTLMNLITGIDHPSKGAVHVNGHCLQKLKNRQLTAWRGRHVGIVFQFFQLLPTLNLLQNVILPMDFQAEYSKKQRRERAMYLLQQVGLDNQALRLPQQISGGQQQRAAIARALANDPELIVADEPTGNLDSASADSVFQLFCQLREQGKTLIMVTHNESLANAASRKLAIHDGRIHSDQSLTASS